MKIPRKPPDVGDLRELVSADPERFVSLVLSIQELTVQGRYLHWHKLRFYTPPEGVTHVEWWHALKIKRRNAIKNVPVKSVSENCFSFNVVDPIPERLHHIDSLARGYVGAPQEVTNTETKNRYLFHSLMEEAFTSSQLEGASTTRDVAKEMIRQGRPPRDRSERMILNNYRTMQRIGELRQIPMSQELVFEIHRIVTEGTLDDNSAAGRFRRESEEIVVGNEEDQVFHVPPNAATLPRRMAAMCDFANKVNTESFIHPVLRAIILHFWLAYDHPFVDGNGRTARALFYWSMLNQGYWLFEYVSISEIIVKAPVKYGMAFLYTETDENDLTYFLLYHTEVIERAIDSLNQYIGQKSQEVRRMEANLKGMSALNHRQRALVSHALRHPGHRYTMESHRVSHGVVYQTARTDLLGLSELGLLNKYKHSKLWYFVPAKDLEERLGNLP